MGAKPEMIYAPANYIQLPFRNGFLEDKILVRRFKVLILAAALIGLTLVGLFCSSYFLSPQVTASGDRAVGTTEVSGLLLLQILERSGRPLDGEGGGISARGFAGQEGTNGEGLVSAESEGGSGGQEVEGAESVDQPSLSPNEEPASAIAETESVMQQRREEPVGGNPATEGQPSGRPAGEAGDSVDSSGGEQGSANDGQDGPDLAREAEVPVSRSQDPGTRVESRPVDGNASEGGEAPEVVRRPKTLREEKGRIDGEGRSRTTPRQENDQWLSLNASLENAALPGKIVILTTFTKSWTEMMDLWLERIERIEDARGVMDHLLVLTFDQSTLDSCRGYNFICYLDPQADANLADSKELLYLSTPYMIMIWRRIELVKEVVAMGYTVMFSDTDVVWLKNPLPFLQGGEEDMAVACDIWQPDPQQVTMNGGFWFMKHNERTLAFLDYWLEDHNQRYPGMHDQDVFNRIRPEVDAHTAKNIGVTIRYLPTFRIGTMCQMPDDFRTLVTMHGNCRVGHDSKMSSLKTFLSEYDEAMKRTD